MEYYNQVRTMYKRNYFASLDESSIQKIGRELLDLALHPKGRDVVGVSYTLLPTLE